jgi:hypothetical protein
VQPASAKANATAVPPRTIERFVISFLLYKFPSRKPRIGQPPNRQSPTIRKPYSNSGAGAWVIRISLVERSLLSRDAGGTGTRPCESLDEQGRDSESPERVRDGTACRIVKLDGLVLAVPHRILAEDGWGKLFAAPAPSGGRYLVPQGTYYWSL